jgi:hypothetical protein
LLLLLSVTPAADLAIKAEFRILEFTANLQHV